MVDRHHKYMAVALEEARLGLQEGGIPIGSALVVDEKTVGRGHNRRVQSGNPILHAEIDCLQNAGRLASKEYRRATLYTTLSPCHMCTGAVLLFKIPRVVVAENQTFMGAEDLLRSQGVEVINLVMGAAIELMERFARENSQLWSEDIGEA